MWAFPCSRVGLPSPAGRHRDYTGGALRSGEVSLSQLSPVRRHEAGRQGAESLASHDFRRLFPAHIHDVSLTIAA